MSFAALMLLLAAPEGCVAPLAPALDRPSFPISRPIGPARAARITDRFNQAAEELCEAGELKPERLAAFHLLRVQSGEGAVDPIVYADGNTLVLQYIFASADGPSEPALRQAIRCWLKPRRDGCYMN